jgi:hypothetical protein
VLGYGNTSAELFEPLVRVLGKLAGGKVARAGGRGGE